MKEKLKNELLLVLNSYVDNDNLKTISMSLDLLLSNYDISLHKNEVIQYSYTIPETVKIYIVSKKIAGLSEKSLYLYKIVLEDFFQTVQKEQEKITANDVKVYLYKYQKEHNISNRTLDTRRTIICTYFAWLAAEDYIQKIQLLISLL